MLSTETVPDDPRMKLIFQELPVPEGGADAKRIWNSEDRRSDGASQLCFLLSTSPDLNQLGPERSSEFCP